MKSHADMSAVYQKMIDLELYLEPLVTASENWAFNCPPSQQIDPYEASVAQALRCMSKIKLNRLVEWPLPSTLKLKRAVHE